jgi:ubiquinone/menaquinone biosynthesis C-methylase UbiE
MNSLRRGFTEVSRKYDRYSIAQKAAAESLLLLTQLGPREDVLDVGCGSGYLARRIAEITSGKVTAVDPAPGMIAEAMMLAFHEGTEQSEGICFELSSAEDIQMDEAVDVVVCNSVLHWFKDAPRALSACWRALRPGGRMVTQVMATKDYCPNFVRALADVAAAPTTAETFARFNEPFLLLDTADDYAALFRSSGFSVEVARIEEAAAQYSLEQVRDVFESGVGAAYFNPDFYADDGPERRRRRDRLPPGYVPAFRQVLEAAFRSQAGADGAIHFVFNRAYVLAYKK